MFHNQTLLIGSGELDQNGNLPMVMLPMLKCSPACQAQSLFMLVQELADQSIRVPLRGRQIARVVI